LKKFLNTKIDFSKFSVLPREETEFWVKKTIKEFKNEGKKLKILDLFSGTGCIGIAVLKNIKNSLADFGDIDSRSLKQIKINFKLNKIDKRRAKTIRTDIFSKIRGKYDLILANPPYVAKERLSEVQKEVKKFEPKTAWYGGKRGMVYISKFLKTAQKFLKKSGKIYLEFDPLQRKEIERILKKENYKFIFFKDQFGKIRFLKTWIK
jgi:release factor glutamine methyltransferase